MQPTYLPWIGYFGLMDSVDIFVLLDNVQLVKRSWQVRNRIKNTNGEALMLSIPIRKNKHRDELLINEALVNNETDWRQKHLRSFSSCYGRAPFHTEAKEILEQSLYLQTHSDTLFNITKELIYNVKKALGIQTKLIMASNLPIDTDDKQERLMMICKHLGATTFISAPGSANYLEEGNAEKLFTLMDIKLSYQNYHHPDYPQINGSFLPFMGILDLIANVGSQEALNIIRQG